MRPGPGPMAMVPLQGSTIDIQYVAFISDSNSIKTDKNHSPITYLGGYNNFYVVNSIKH